MAIQITCSKCGTRLQVRDEHQGKRLRCPNCKNEIPQVQSTGLESPAAEFASVPQHEFNDEPPSENPYASPQQTYGSSSTHGRYGPLRPHRGGTILTLAVLGIVCCWPFSIAAWVMGVQDLQEMRQERMDRDGEGLTQAGMIVGIVGVAIWVLFVTVGLMVFMVWIGKP